MMQEPSAEEETKLRLSGVTAMEVTSLRCSLRDTSMAWYDECTFHTLRREKKRRPGEREGEGRCG